MEIISLEIPEIKLLRPKVFEDSRGSFQESYNKKTLKEQHGFDYDFVQDNYSITLKKGTIRGLHFQTAPMSQTKLIKVMEGVIMDVVVDIRKTSPTFKKFITIELDSGKQEQILVPKGFAHGFFTLTDNCKVFYKVDNFYSTKHNAGIIWNDKTLNIPWPSHNPLLSDQDKKWPSLENGYTF